MPSVYSLRHHPQGWPARALRRRGSNRGRGLPGGPLALTALLESSIEVAIPIAYVAAVCLNFTLQRHFVFRHIPSFALSTRYQTAVLISAVCSLVLRTQIFRAAEAQETV